MRLEASTDLEDRGPIPTIASPQRRTRVYVLPPLQEKSSDKLTVLILPDGNNRANKKLNEGYDAGGMKVIEIAEALAGTGDVDEMIACIMSKDNVEKRSPDFFRKIYQAFVVLGIRIKTSNLLTRSGIRMETYGDLTEMHNKKLADGKKSPEGMLADMVESVCAQTSHITEPKLRLVLAVNYDRDIAINTGTDIIFRSGMEEDDVIRVSGIRTNPGIKTVGSTTLWPHVNPQQILQIADEVKREKRKGFTPGYNAQFLKDVIEAALERPIADNEATDIVLPYSVSDSHLDSFLAQLKESNINLPDTAIELFDRQGHRSVITDITGQPKRKITLVPASTKYPSENPDSEISALIAPGQSNPVSLPVDPEVGYASVHPCRNSPSDISKAIQKAVDYCLTNEQLRGAERLSLYQSNGTAIPAMGLPEYSHYWALTEHIDPQLTIEQIAEKIQHITYDPSTAETYNLIADLFVAKMLIWAENLKIPLRKDVEFLAFTNYMLTSFFMCYYPSHPKWGEYAKGWEQRAENLAKYMGLVYACDEAIYDIEEEDHNAKMTRIKKATSVITSAIRGKTHEQTDVQTLTHNISEEFRALRVKLKQASNPMLFKQWESALCNLFESFCAEWDKSTFDNTIITNLYAGNYDAAETEIASKYYPKAPEWIKKKMQDAMSEIKASDGHEIPAAVHNLRLFIYLFEIENSIGAGIAYRTIAANTSPSNLDRESIQLHNEICTLSNFYFRLANDLAGFLSRTQSDSETKDDACSILHEKYTASGRADADSVVTGAAEIKDMIDEIKMEIDTRRTRLIKRCPEIGIPMVRADLAELIYKEGHYRTISREKMENFFTRLRKAGLNY